ncbi:MAG: leucyl aminopeptidase family protein [Methylotenera sp.]|nr:leucyl aminopeptidase family protein [Oligoflexia bacterium]
MRFQLLASDKVRASLITPAILVLTLPDWKAGLFKKSLPRPLQKRMEKFSAKLLTRNPEAFAEGVRIQLPGIEKNEEDFWIALLPEEKETFFLLEFARDTLKDALSPSTQKLQLLLGGNPEQQLQLADCFGAALAARVNLLPVYGKRKAKEKKFRLSEFGIASLSRESSGSDPHLLTALKIGFASGEGTHLARYLATLPPNILTSEAYGVEIRKIAQDFGLQHKFHSKTDLKKMGAGAFVAVDQGDPDSGGGIHELTYLPGKSLKALNAQPISFVGKGLCFDTGGYDIKVSSGMQTMKGDMQGSAVALATLVTASKLKLPVHLKAFLAVTENHLSPKAYKADEVVTALNGMSIEIIHTDAEGRMVLADTLTMASREKPHMVVDFATLTGTAMQALGTKYSAVFSNRKELHPSAIQAGEISGERVWTFPMDSTYFKALESKVADIAQCTKGRGPDHIYAACFLSKFIENKTPWVHVDLSTAENEGGLGHVDSLFTGFGVRWALEFLRICLPGLSMKS